MTTGTDRLTEAWSPSPGLNGWLANLNHRAIGARFILTAFIFFLLGGIQGLLIRLQLVTPNNELLSPEAYNQFFTMHGTTMMFLFAVPMLEGFAMYLLPLMLGARDMPYPKLNAFGYFCFLFGGLFLYASFFTGDVPDGGWFAYVPLTSADFSPGMNMDFWLLGITFVEISAIAAAIEIIVLIFKFRAPGMTISRMPLFAWAMLAVAFAILFAFPPLIAGSIMLEADRVIGTHFYNAAAGGDPLLWQHLFWVFGHPEVYIIFLPAAGFVSMIIPAFARRPMVAYMIVALAAVVTAFLSFGLWVHHMFATGLPRLALAFFTAASLAISIPAGLQVFAWIGTLWAGERPALKLPLMYVLGFLVIFVAGGITGVMVAVVPFDLQVHDTFFVVAHFHYVLMGGMTFPLFAAFYYWLPKMTGRMMDERTGHIGFWLIFIGFNVTFFPMHIMGLLGMPRRIYTYQSGLGWDFLNLLSTIGAFVLAAGALVFIANVVHGMRRGAPAGDDPWRSNTLEWATASPPAPYSFRHVPVVRGRSPLWDQADVFDASGRGDLAGLDLSDPPGGARQLLMTTSLEAAPERLITILGSSLWPLVMSLGLGAFFAGVLLSVYLLSAGGLLVALVALIGWHWPDRSRVVPPEANRPLRPSGAELGSEVGWLAMALLLTTLLALMAAIYFAYFLIWSGAGEWPIGALSAPDFDLAALLTLAVLAGAAAAWVARLAWHSTNARRVRNASVAAAGLGTGFMALIVIELARQDFGATSNAYGSVFFAVMTVQGVAVAIALSVSAWTVVRAWRGDVLAEHRVSVENAALAWGFAALTWFATLGVVYGVPYLGAPEGVRL